MNGPYRVIRKNGKCLVLNINNQHDAEEFTPGPEGWTANEVERVEERCRELNRLWIEGSKYF